MQRRVPKSPVSEFGQDPFPAVLRARAAAGLPHQPAPLPLGDRLGYRCLGSIALVMAFAASWLCAPEGTWGGETNRDKALFLVRACLQTQSAMDSVSMRVVTDRDVPNSSDNWPRSQRMETVVRRDHDRLDVAQRCFFPKAPQDTRAHRWRAVTTRESGAAYYAGLDESTIPKGMVNDDWAEWFTRHGLNETTGGPLDGYFPSTGSRRVAELMVACPDLRLRGAETIADIPCQIVEANTPYGTYTMWIAESKGFLPLKVTSAIGPEDVADYRTKRRLSEITISSRDGQQRAGSTSVCSLDDVGITKVGDRFVSIAGKFTRTDIYGDVRLFAVNAYQRSEITLNPRFEGTDAFVIDLPEGAHLNNMADSSSGVIYEWRGGKPMPAGTEFHGDLATGSWAGNSALIAFLWGLVGIALFGGGLTMALSGQDSHRRARPQPRTKASHPSKQLPCVANIVVIALLALSSNGAGAGEPARLKTPPSKGVSGSSHPRSYCGVQSLYRALRALELPVSFSDLVNPKYISSKKGSSVSDLKQAGEDMGAFVTPMNKMTCGMLRHVRVPVILHVKSDMGAKDYNHWVLFMGTGGGKARIYDGEQPAVEMDLEELAARWDGIGLLVSKSPLNTLGIGLIGTATLVFYLGVAAFVAGVLYRVERRWELEGVSVGASLRSSIAQAVGLVALTVGALFACRFVSDAGFLSSRAAIAAIQDANFGAFLPKVNSTEMARLLDAPNVAIVDARFRQDFDTGHLKGAISIPVGSSRNECQEALAQVPKDHRIVIYSQSNGCAFGDRVARELISLGYHNIHLYRGGWIEWKKYHPLPSKSEPAAKGNQG